MPERGSSGVAWAPPWPPQMTPRCTKTPSITPLPISRLLLVVCSPPTHPLTLASAALPQVQIPTWALVHLPVAVTLSTSWFTRRGWVYSILYVLFENAMGTVKLWAVITGVGGGKGGRRARRWAAFGVDSSPSMRVCRRRRGLHAACAPTGSARPRPPRSHPLRAAALLPAGLLDLQRAQEWVVTTKLGSSDKRPGTSASPIAMPSCRLYLGELGMALFTLAAASCALFSGASLGLSAYLLVQGALSVWGGLGGVGSRGSGGQVVGKTAGAELQEKRASPGNP